LDLAPVGQRHRQAPQSISVVMATRDGEKTLPSQLRGLAAQTYAGPWEVVVVDNGSKDQTLEVARSWSGSGALPNLTVRSAPERRGAPYARNVGAAIAGAPLLAFCDQDDVVTPGWLDALATAARGADVVGGALEVRTLNDPVALSWYPPAWTAEWEAWERPPLSMRHMPFVFMCNAAVWTDVFRELGGCDERFVRGARTWCSPGRLSLPGSLWGGTPKPWS